MTLQVLAGVLTFLLTTAQQPARPDASAALPTQSAVSPRLDSLANRISRLERMVEHPPKDFWDKLSATAALLSGILVAGIGFYATNIYNRRQRDAEETRKDRELIVSKVQTVEKFIPHLASMNESTQAAALIAISALGDEQLAVKLARTFKGTGSTIALASIATGGGSSAVAATKALTDLFEYLKARVVTLHSGSERRASGFVVSEDGLVITTAYAVRLIEPDSLRVGFPNGKSASAVVLATDETEDLALLRTESPESLPAIEPTLAVPRIGGRVIALMISLEGTFSAEVGQVSAVRTDVDIGGLRKTARDRIGVRLKLEVASGGVPVLSETGRLIGIVEGGDDAGNGFLIPAGRALAFLAHHGSAPAL